VGIFFLGWIATRWPGGLVEEAFSGHNDFVQLYAGARLIGSPGLYSPEANLRVQRELIGLQSPSVLYSRLPFYAFLLKPLTAAPYHRAYIIFQIVNIACLVGTIGFFARRQLEIGVLAAYSVPALAAVLVGQDLGLVIFFYAAFYWLSERGQEFTAGLALSLCSLNSTFFRSRPSLCCCVKNGASCVALFWGRLSSSR